MQAAEATPSEDAPRRGPLTLIELTMPQATERCLHLRRRGWSWPAIARAMRDYHGIDTAPATWRSRCLCLAPYFGVDPESLKIELTPNKQRALVEHNRRHLKLAV